MRKFIFIVTIFSCLSIASFSQNMTLPEQLAQQQLDAYNNRNIEAFLVPYSDSVEVYIFPNQLQYKGKENMRSQYKPMFERLTDLNCKLVNRMVMGNTVIDHEWVIFDKNQPGVSAISIYTIQNNKIQKVHFIRGQ